MRSPHFSKQRDLGNGMTIQHARVYRL